ncbi:MAG TPA: hypothetical protein VJ820_13405 [Propionibacteriaceae bacterium]|jgi:hypothetical protein|nr:hypothetical protein [Propionibacteriaceae bacterium]
MITNSTDKSAYSAVSSATGAGPEQQYCDNKGPEDADRDRDDRAPWDARGEVHRQTRQRNRLGSAPALEGLSP